ncbi:MAG TPA: hypothetical protein DCE44_07675, partial [Verrucomicrobiales bacterium]|nr:hypothetical protein [Verrucomicrobiales bacterium]
MRANNAPSTITGSGLSGDAVFAGTNRYVVFLSDAPDLVTNDFNGSLVDVFVRDRITGRTELVSRSPAGQSFNGRSSEFSVSGDGTLIAFTVEGSDASAGDTNRVNDVYVRDLKIGTTRLVSVNVSGTGAGNTASSNPELSGDGRFIVFESEATNLTANVDTNGASDVFLRDLQEGSTEVLSTAPGGSTGSAAAFSPQINVDGRVVAYRCLATDFPLIEDNGTTLVLWRRSEQLRRIRLSPTARFQLPIWVEDFILSRNGRYLAFRVQGPSGNINFVSTWWTDLESGRLERVAGDLPVLQEPLSLADDGQTLALTVRPERSGLSDQIRIWKADSGLHTMDEMRTTVPPVGTDPATSQLPQLSSDGNSLLFVSSSPVPEAGVLAEGSSRLYHRVLATGAMHHMAAEANYAQAAFSPDGTEVVLQVEEPVSLLDLNESYDVITVNLADGQTSPISVTESAMEKRTATGISRGAGTPSDDGRFVPFVSLADDLVPGDTSRGYDGYLFDRSFGAVQPMATALFSGDSQGAMGCLRISRDGRTALFMSSQPGLVAGDTNQLADIFTRDLTTGVVTLVSAIDGTD